jgi:hypothetical protein
MTKRADRHESIDTRERAENLESTVVRERAVK